MNVCPTGSFAYSVEDGDTLWQIAEKFDITVDAILELNPGLNPDNLPIGQIICLPLATEIPPYEPIYSETELNNRLRLLWAQYYGWLRLSIIFLVFDLPKFEDAYRRLLRVPGDFGDLLTNIYDDVTAKQFTNLLEENIIITIRIIKALKTGNKSSVDNLTEQWQRSANRIASFLVAVNQYWGRDEWMQLLSNLFDLIKTETLYYLGSGLAEDTFIFDETEGLVLDIADTMIDGILSQFPERFD